MFDETNKENNKINVFFFIDLNIKSPKHAEIKHNVAQVCCWCCSVYLGCSFTKNHQVSPLYRSLKVKSWQSFLEGSTLSLLKQNQTEKTLLSFSNRAINHGNSTESAQKIDPTLHEPLTENVMSES